MDPPEDRTPSPDPPDDPPLQPWWSSSSSRRVAPDPPPAQEMAAPAIAAHAAPAIAPDVSSPQQWRPSSFSHRVPLDPPTFCNCPPLSEQQIAVFEDYAASHKGGSSATSSVIVIGEEDEEAEEDEETGLGQDVGGGAPNEDIKVDGIVLSPVGEEPATDSSPAHTIPEEEDSSPGYEGVVEAEMEVGDDTSVSSMDEYGVRSAGDHLLSGGRDGNRSRGGGGRGSAWDRLLSS